MTAPDDLLHRLDEAIAAATDLGLLDDGRLGGPRRRRRDGAAIRATCTCSRSPAARASASRSLLNALAGSVVSMAGTQRPTTTGAVAWVPAGRETAVGSPPRVAGRRRHRGSRGPTPAQAALDAVAVLDLPDLDSIEPGHAARVDAVLPRVDAVAWVSDPEKYADAVLHDRYLRRWATRLDRQAFVLNKTDRVSRARRGPAARRHPGAPGRDRRR